MNTPSTTSSETNTSAASKSAARHWQIWLERLGPLLALVIVTIGFAIADQIWGTGTFIEFRNVRVMLMFTAPVAVAALGMTLVIMTGGIDLSAGTAGMLCATVLACTLNAQFPVPVAIAFALLTGAFCGLLNGFFIGILKIAPFIVTLGSMTIFLGIAKRLAGDSTVFVNRNYVPEWLNRFSSTNPPDWLGWFPNISMAVWCALFVAILVAIVLNLTVFGRHLQAVGSNEATARLCGINVFMTKVWVYSLAGMLFGLYGVYSFTQLRLANPSEGIGKELKFIAAVVIGGGSLSGGKGTVLGTLAGSAIMVVISNGCTQLEISNATQDIVIGTIIVAAVTVDQLRNKRRAAGGT